MTREEAKAYAKRVIDLGLNDETQAFCEVVLEVLEQEPCEDWHDVPSDEMTLGQARQAVKDLRKKLAEYLWQTPCKDAISRQEVLDVIERWLECSGYNEAERHIMRAVQSVLYDSPSVTPQPKTGHWIKTGDYLITAFGNVDYVKCSCCREYGLEKGNYCPNCGAKMIEPQESEDKE